jgi:hypothetical protein
MIFLKYRWSLYKLTKDRDKTRKHYSKKIDEAQKKKAYDERESLIHEAMEVTGFINDDISYLITQNLRSKAEKLLLPFPTSNELWEQSPRTGKRFLTNEGIIEIRTKIRKEQRKRREKIAFWISILIGLIGALTGFMAVIKR